MAGALATLLAAPLVAAPAAHAQSGAQPALAPAAREDAGSVVDCSDPAQAESAHGACTSVRPTFSCVWDNGGGSYTAVLGYSNPSKYTLKLPPGTWVNSFYGLFGDPLDRGQPSTFPPGSYPTAFTVTWTQAWPYTTLWALGSHHMIAFSSGSKPACATQPVPIVASVGTLGAAALTMMVIFGIANRRAVARQRAATAGSGKRGRGDPGRRRRGGCVVSAYPGFDEGPPFGDEPL